MNIFELLYEDFKFPKDYKIKLFEAFAGVGMQRMAMNKINANYESVGISEIDKHAINSYMAIHGETKNFGSICDIKGIELPQIDIFTWSFPCTDLSKAGQQKGLSKETRSGLVYEVLRIMHECSNVGNLPKVLIMENVVDLIQVKFIDQFNEIQRELEELGYKNYVQTMNAKNYGIPQNRDRVFMVSILGEYNYSFKEPFDLKLRLNDLLQPDEEVEDKYYLSDKMINCLISEHTKGFNRKERFIQTIKNTNIDGIASTLCTSSGSRPTDNFIITNINPIIKKILIKEATKKWYTEAYEGDGVYINRPHQKRGVVQDGMIPALKTSGNDVGVCVPVLTPNRIKKRQNGRRFKEDGDPMFTLTAQDRHGVYDGLTIRRLTPKEYWRLMGIDDEEFEKAQKVTSNTQLYKQAGNGIVVDVFSCILERLIESENYNGL